MATTTPLLGLHKPAMGDTVSMTIPNLAADMQTIDEKLGVLSLESGTWTPAIAGSTTAGNNSYQFRNGRYMKIGQGVYVTASMQLSSKDPNMAGYIVITGLPFAVGNQSSVLPGVAEYMSLDSEIVQVTYKLISGATIGLWASRSDAYDIQIDVSKLKNGSLLRVSGWYFV